MRWIRPILIIVVSLVALRMQEVRAQTFQKHWKSVMIPGDSLWPGYMTFADSNIGYLKCGRYRITKTSSPRAIEDRFFRTTDGGKTWLPVQFGAPFSATVAGQGVTEFLHVVSPAVAFCYVPDTSKLPPPNGRFGVPLLKTTNSGATWKEVTLRGGIDPQRFLTEDHFLAHGIVSNKTILESLDGGSSFHAFGDMYPLSHYTVGGTYYSDSGAGAGFCFFDTAHWIAFVNDLNDTNSIQAPPLITPFVSSDGARHWTIYHSELPDSLIGDRKFFTSNILSMIGSAGDYPGNRLKTIPNTGYLFGKTSGEFSNQGIWHNNAGESRGLLSYYYTPDYGETWHFGCDFPYRVRGFEAVDTNEIWMTVLPKRNEYYEWANTKVFTTNYDASWIVHSTDLGKTWEIDSTTLDGRPYDELFYDGAIVSSSDPAHVWIAAEYNYHTYIFRYNKNEQKSGVEEYVPLNYPNFVNIYPNPAQTHTTITLARGCPISNVTLVDIMGRDVTAPLTRLKEYSVDLDISKLQSGIYIAGIRTPYGPYAKLVSVVK